MQLQAAMSLPMRRVPISREGLYNILAFLKRHRARESPRAIRFELEPGRPVAIVLEPWEQRSSLHGDGLRRPARRDDPRLGPRPAPLLARLLPLLDEAEVYLLGTRPAELLVDPDGRDAAVAGPLGLDGQRLDRQLGARPARTPGRARATTSWATSRPPSSDQPALTFDQIQQRTGAAPAFVAAGLNRLALLGQVIHDLHAGLYRWRQIMPVALSLELIGPENPETAAARELVARDTREGRPRRQAARRPPHPRG